MTETSDATRGGPPRTGDEALARLLAGNARFVAGRKLDHDTLRRAELAAGQEPFAVILGCADSRVPPEAIFDQGLGELFVVRVAGNTAVEPLVLGSVEFALANLGSRLVVVLGHQGCGAIEGAVAAVTEDATAPGSIGDVIAPIVPVVQGVAEAESGLSPAELRERSVRANVRAAVADLSARSPVLAERIGAGDVKLVGAEYRLATGEVVLV
ncbi:MAG TPA: carbonic anhydrase [Solirubrobacterales bacterium]